MKIQSTDGSAEHILDLGYAWWKRFCNSNEGETLLKLLPSTEHYARAMKLFQMGFAGRLDICPPLGKPELDRLLTPTLCLGLWEQYLEISTGEILLDGEAHPVTPPILLTLARMFFVRGFVAASIAWEHLEE